MSQETGHQFLKHQYNLQNQPEVEAAAFRTNKRHELQAGEDGELETVGQDPESQIQNYLDRFTEITDRENPAWRQHGLEALKRLLYRQYIIRPENIPDSYWQAQREQARQLGVTNFEITEEMKNLETQRVIADQKESLDRWIDYLAGPDAHYPDYLKYVAIRSLLSMGNYDANRHTFTERTAHTVKRFPTLSYGALGRTIDSIERYYGERYFALKRQLEAAQEAVKRAKNALSYAQKLNSPDANSARSDLVEAKHKVAELTAQFADLINGQAEENVDQPKFNGALLSADFATLYALALEKSGTAKQELWPVTAGQWVTYTQGQEAKLVAAIDGKGTDWCLEGTATSKYYLDKGKLLVYFSEDEQGQPTIPRAGVWLVDEKVVESRGVDQRQNLDPYIADIVRAKAQELGDPEFEKRAFDMQMLTYIERKTKAGQQLNKDDLIFLYEINGSIEGFGYGRDPRVKELRSQRNPEEDAPIVFECQPEEIAHTATEITEATKAYIGPLETGIFDRLPKSLEHIYTAFPEGKIRRTELTIGGQTKEQLISELGAHNINISDYAEDMIKSPDFTTLESAESVDVVRLKVSDLGFTQSPTTDQLYAKAAELGLELCPAEVGPYLRLQDTNQPLNEWYYIAMKQVSDRDGHPTVFYLERNDGDLSLDTCIGDPTDRWNIDYRLVFRVRQISPEPYLLKDFDLP